MQCQYFYAYAYSQSYLISNSKPSINNHYNSPLEGLLFYECQRTNLITLTCGCIQPLIYRIMPSLMYFYLILILQPLKQNGKNNQHFIQTIIPLLGGFIFILVYPIRVGIFVLRDLIILVSHGYRYDSDHSEL